MRLGALLYLYGRRLRTHPIQELLAAAGMAIGVALLLAVIVANTSIGGSVAQLVGGIAGNAQLQVVARGDAGIDARLADAVRGLPGVVHAAPLLEQRAQLVGPRGDIGVLLVGVDPTLATVGGELTRGIGPAAGIVLRDGLLLPSGIAARLGARRLPLGALVAHAPGRTVVVRMRGAARRVRVAAVLGPELIGPLPGRRTRRGRGPRAARRHAPRDRACGDGELLPRGAVHAARPGAARGRARTAPPRHAPRAPRAALAAAAGLSTVPPCPRSTRRPPGATPPSAPAATPSRSPSTTPTAS